MGMYATGLSGLLKLTKEQYDAMESHDTSTKYIVVDGGVVQEYLGDIPIGGGSSGGVITGVPVAITSGCMATTALVGVAEEVV